MIEKAATWALALALASGLAGCRVHVDKDANGEEKKVQVDTPFGGVHVNTDQTTAADLGLPVYLGATAVKNDDAHKSADVHLGFGPWELRVRTVSYQTPDAQEKVEAFYKKALSRYGDVITCRDNVPVGVPTKTSEGLTCADDVETSTAHGAGRKVGNETVIHSESSDSKGDLELKAGSKRRQHIVGFEDPRNGKTCFALVALELPADEEKNSGKSD